MHDVWACRLTENKEIVVHQRVLDVSCDIFVGKFIQEVSVLMGSLKGRSTLMIFHACGQASSPRTRSAWNLLLCYHPPSSSSTIAGS